MRILSILAAAIFGFGLAVEAQPLKVVQVSGSIVKGESPIQVGDELDKSQSDQIVFQDDAATASLFHPDQGKWYLTKSGFEPAPANASGGATRPALCKNIRAFGLNDQGQPYKYLVLGTLEQPVSELDMPLEDPERQYFTVRYQHQGKTVERKLEAVDNKVVISREAIFGDLNPREVTNLEILYYGNADEPQGGSFKPVFPNEEELKAEIEMIVNAHNGDNYVIFDKVMQHLKDFYGSPNHENVMNWLYDHYNIDLQ